MKDTSSEQQAVDFLRDAPPAGQRALALLFRRILEFRERRLKAEAEAKQDGDRSGEG